MLPENSTGSCGVETVHLQEEQHWVLRGGNSSFTRRTALGPVGWKQLIYKKNSTGSCGVETVHLQEQHWVLWCGIKTTNFYSDGI